MMIERIEAAGLVVRINGAKLAVIGKLDDKQRSFIRTHKLDLMAELRLRLLAEEMQHPLADLLSWYVKDLRDLSRMNDEDLHFVVCDYINHRDFYRRPHQHQNIATR